MSLVGSLEDLGLGDILQIVSLSRKSGLLLLRSEEGEGRIVFFEGLVRAAFVKGEAEDLKGLLTAGGFLEEEAYERAAEAAAAHGDPVSDVLAALPGLTKERINSLRREHVERSVFSMFGWATGEFSFEIRDEVDERDRELMLPTGINAQYLTMEATRLGDEGEKAGYGVDIEFGTIDGAGANPSGNAADEPQAPVAALETTETRADPFAAAEALALAAVSSCEEPGDEAGADLAATAEAEPAATAEEVADAQELEEADEVEPAEEIATTEVVAEAGDVDAAESSVSVEEETTPPASATRRRPASTRLGSLILMDPDLNSLEWQKVVLGPLFERIHIFQRVDSGISRLRQYLRRGEEPVVLVSDTLPGDPVAGFNDSAGLIKRLRAHAPHLPVFLVRSGGAPASRGIGLADACLLRPAGHQLANRRAWPRLEAAGEALRAGIQRSLTQDPVRAGGASAPVGKVTGGLAGEGAATLGRLKQMSERLRDPSVRGEVLSLILEYSAELFRRVAIFMVRDDDAIGMAQVGLDRAGGPSDDEFRAIHFPAADSAWFSAVLAKREGVKAPPANEGDQRLAMLIGSAVPREAYVAPIESSHRVVALVYGDNLPSGEPVGETASLEIVLHEAGLALERAVLERALADAAR